MFLDPPIDNTLMLFMMVNEQARISLLGPFICTEGLVLHPQPGRYLLKVAGAEIELHRYR